MTIWNWFTIAAGVISVCAFLCSISGTPSNGDFEKFKDSMLKRFEDQSINHERLRARVKELDRAGTPLPNSIGPDDFKELVDRVLKHGYVVLKLGDVVVKSGREGVWTLGVKNEFFVEKERGKPDRDSMHNRVTLSNGAHVEVLDMLWDANKMVVPLQEIIDKTGPIAGIVTLQSSERRERPEVIIARHLTSRQVEL